jgi:KDO2-lipid IV(A) lauroyltransferase
MLVVDVIFTPRLVRKDNWRQYSRFKNTERAKWLSKEGNGLIFVGAHYGNFEILGYMMGLFGFNTYSIARPLDNRFISKYLYGVRERAGQKIIDKKGAAELFDKVASSGATVCFVADQDAGDKGIFVDFFGRKASTYKSIGLLAITNNIPIVIGYGRRIDNRFFFEIGVQRIIFPDEWADKKDPLRWVTAEYTKAIEEFVREDPTQYWWLHRRWKHRPKDEQPAQVTPATEG